MASVVSTWPVGALIENLICHRQFLFLWIYNEITISKKKKRKEKENILKARIRGADHILAVYVFCVFFFFLIYLVFAFFLRLNVLL